MNTKLIMTVEEMQDRKKWEAMRNIGIGGSDASAIGKVRISYGSKRPDRSNRKI